jgi:hypothetical protein
MAAVLGKASEPLEEVSKQKLFVASFLLIVHTHFST